MQPQLDSCLDAVKTKVFVCYSHKEIVPSKQPQRDCCLDIAINDHDDIVASMQIQRVCFLDVARMRLLLLCSHNEGVGSMQA